MKDNACEARTASWRSSPTTTRPTTGKMGPEQRETEDAEPGGTVKEREKPD